MIIRVHSWFRKKRSYHDFSQKNHVHHVNPVKKKNIRLPPPKTPGNIPVPAQETAPFQKKGVLHVARCSPHTKPPISGHLKISIPPNLQQPHQKEGKTCKKVHKTCKKVHKTNTKQARFDHYTNKNNTNTTSHPQALYAKIPP